ncbi:YidH family protein [Sphingomonas sp.]|uniref:YidH family protein n=1 Tax=Sphingomonas sp. TaxID=28214 RepID=UPI0035BBB2F6
MTGQTRQDRTELAEDRTDLAEDRTLLANERTFSGWARTAMASIGVGLGFNALFKAVRPTWFAKGIASLFILLGIFLIMAAERRAHSVRMRLTAHEVNGLSVMTFRIMAAAIIMGAIGLLVAIWWLA